MLGDLLQPLQCECLDPGMILAGRLVFAGCQTRHGDGTGTGSSTAAVVRLTGHGHQYDEPASSGQLEMAVDLEIT